MRVGRRRTRAAIRSLDHRLLRLLRTRGHAPPIEAAVVGIASTGESGLIWYALAGCGGRASRGAASDLAVYALAVTMALSRPYLGAHYPSDVIAGAILGDDVAELVP
jgi:PAP2 superfamily